MQLSSENHYANHLVELNKSNKVLISEDVYNERGVLVARKGLEFNLDTAKKIARHKLIKPLETSVTLECVLNSFRLSELFNQRLNILQIKKVVIDIGLLDKVTRAFEHISHYPLILQKLTIMAERMPDQMGRSLMSAAVSLEMSRELRLSEHQTRQIFIACLIADVGLLHIDPDVAFKDAPYSQEEWQQMKGHVAISSHFADMIPGLPKVVARAVLEHHERFDGFGYPFSRKGDELCIEGQIIAMADTCSALYRKLIKNGTYSWSAVLTVLQLPSQAHCQQVRNAILRVLRRANLSHALAYQSAEYPEVVRGLLEQYRRLKAWFTQLTNIYQQHQTELDRASDLNHYELFENLREIIITTGVLSSQQLSWLESFEKGVSTSEFRDIEEFKLKLDEITYQALFTMRVLQGNLDAIARNFEDKSLPESYYEALMDIVSS